MVLPSRCVGVFPTRKGTEMPLTPLVGSTYPTVTGENTPKGGAFARIIGELPGLQLWSVYYDGSDLPSWNEEWFNPQYDHIRYYIISLKTADVNAVGARMATMPAHLRGRIIILLHHEPDQYRSASDTRGDPAPDVWWARQVAFLDLRDDSVWGPWVQFAVCFTEDRARTDAAVWEQNWGRRVPTEPRIDWVMWDCFNIGRSIVRTGADMYRIPLDYGRRCMVAWGRTKPVVMIRENGQVTPVDQPTDSTAVADGVAEHWEYAKANADVIAGKVWYYNHHNTLADPTGIRRPLTLGVLQGMLAEAIEAWSFQPDPDDPQYQAGYDAGRASRDAQVAELLEQNAALSENLANTQALLTAAEATIVQLQQDVDNAAQTGRDEVIDAVNAAMAPFES